MTSGWQFLDDSTHQNVLLCMEGATHALPLWHCSEYPSEMETLVACLSKCTLVHDPVEQKASGSEAGCHP